MATVNGNWINGAIIFPLSVRCYNRYGVYLFVPLM